MLLWAWLPAAVSLQQLVDSLAELQSQVCLDVPLLAPVHIPRKNLLQGGDGTSGFSGLSPQARIRLAAVFVAELAEEHSRG